MVHIDVPMRSVFARCGVEVNRAGYALCPFHGEKTPSLKVYDTSFYCFGCGKGGDAVTFVRALYGLTFREALAKLQSDFSLAEPVRVERAPPKKADGRFAAYLDLVQREEALLFLRGHYAPQPGDETLHPAFVYALRALETVRHEILIFDFERKEK